MTACRSLNAFANLPGEPDSIILELSLMTARRFRSLFTFASALLLAVGLLPRPAARAETPNSVSNSAPEATVTPAVAVQPGAELAPETSAVPAAAALPPGIEVGSPGMVPVPGDRPALVIHAPAENARPIIYLHGLCGNVRAVESWKEAATAHGTLIALLGDRPCGGGRFRWGKNLDVLQARIGRALAAVRAARGGLLDPSQLVLFGYSQGADKAEMLAARWNDQYRLVILGGPPRTPKLRDLGNTTAVAVFGGELETTGHMRTGAELLAAAGKPVRFFLLPAAKHGEFGPEGNRVMRELLSWILTAG